MKHLGDITKINGAEIEPVDCITGGSPCQDLSVAGKRAGLSGERSGLFMEQIRVVKEMREHDRSIGRSGVAVRPRYMVWENVPGAFSSNGGKDFQAVLTEIVRVVEQEAPDVPMPDKRWPKAGCLYDELGRWSVAWRLHDAQFWGVAQRRKRIALVADFGGMSAPEILFERKGLSGNTEQGCKEGKKSSGCAADRAGIASVTIRERAGCDGGGKGVLVQVEKSGSIKPINDQTMIAFTQNQRDELRDLHDVRGTLVAEPGMKQQTYIVSDIQCSVAAFRAKAGAKAGSIGFSEELSPTLESGQCGFMSPAVCLGNGQTNQAVGEIAGTLNCMHDQQAVYIPGVSKALKNKANCDFREDSETYVVTGLDCRNGRENGDLCGTLQSKPNGGFSNNSIHPVRIGSIVRRLTPLECERLQGFPDNYCSIPIVSEISFEDQSFWNGIILDNLKREGKVRKNENGCYEIWKEDKDEDGNHFWENTHKPYSPKTERQLIRWYNKMISSDTPRYKALGNSIAVGYANNRSGFWCWLMKRISAQYERSATLGSLFDGIGGFPLAWEAVNGKGTARWASEIEEFPIAVTKYHFPEE